MLARAFRDALVLTSFWIIKCPNVLDRLKLLRAAGLTAAAAHLAGPAFQAAVVQRPGVNVPASGTLIECVSNSHLNSSCNSFADTCAARACRNRGWQDTHIERGAQPQH
jgi:hypothetical protein